MREILLKLIPRDHISDQDLKMLTMVGEKLIMKSTYKSKTFYFDYKLHLVWIQEATGQQWSKIEDMYWKQK